MKAWYTVEMLRPVSAFRRRMDDHLADGLAVVGVEGVVEGVEQLERHVGMADLNGQQDHDRDMGGGDLIRITSYNVCYTKLLRVFRSSR